MKKHLASTMVSLIILVLFLAACGKPAASPAASGTSAAATQQPATAAPAASTAPSASAAAPAAGSGKMKDLVIGFSNGYFGNTWRSQFVDDFTQAAEKYKKDGVIKEYIAQNSNGVPEQVAVINSFINKKVDAIIIDPISSSALAPVVAKAQAQGILVVDVSEPGEYPNVINVVGDNANMMKVVTRWLAENMSGKGSIVYVAGIAGNAADQIRNKAVNEVLKDYKDIKVLAQGQGEWSETKSNAVMSTFLSTYNNIDGVLAQDVMSQGILQSFKAANKKPPIMTGDYTFGFLRKWKDMPELKTITNTYAPGLSANALGVTVKLLQGYKLKADVLKENPFNGKTKDTLFAPMPYIVVKQKDDNAKWMKEVDPLTKVITLDEALNIGDGKPDTTALDGYWSDGELNKLFESK